MLYKDRIYMDNVQMMCANGHEEVMFFTDDETRDAFLRTHDELTIVRDDHPTQKTIEAYEKVFEIELVKPVELTARHLAMLVELAAVLDRTPAEMLLEVFSHPPPKSKLPKRWI